MLAISDNAAKAIEAILASDDVPDGAGLRIGTEAEDGERVGLGLALVQSPAESDQVVERGNAQVFVEEAAAELLDDKMLDARADGERIAFTVVEQSAE